MEVVREGYVDPTQFDKSDPHFDPSSKPEEPKWFAVDVKFVRLLKRFVSLAELRRLFREHGKTGGALAGMALFTQGRLSVQPVTKEQFDFILSLEAEKPWLDSVMEADITQSSHIYATYIHGSWFLAANKN